MTCLQETKLSLSGDGNRLDKSNISLLPVQSDGVSPKNVWMQSDYWMRSQEGETVIPASAQSPTSPSLLKLENPTGISIKIRARRARVRPAHESPIPSAE